MSKISLERKLIIMEVCKMNKALLIILCLLLGFSSLLFSQETGYLEDFNNPVDLDFWTPNKLTHEDGTPVFAVSQEDSALKVVMKQKNFYDGQYYNFVDSVGMNFDLTEHPYVSIKIKVEPGAKYGGVETSSVLFLLSPWGPDSTGENVRQVDSPSAEAPADGEWHEILFDFGAKIGVPMWNGVVPPGDLSQIGGFLFETVKWPDTYEATFWIDDFRVGDSVQLPPTTDPIEFENIPALTDKFYTTWTVTPTHAPMDGVTGLAKGEVAGFTDMGILVRFNSSSRIDARNGGDYDAVNELSYEAGRKYTVKVTADVKAQTYDAEVTPDGGAPVLIADDFAFRPNTPQDTLRYFAMVINELEEWGGVPGSRLTPSFLEDDYELNFVDNRPIDPQTGSFTVTFNMTPTAQRINSAVALLKGSVIMDAWGDLSAIIRCNMDNFIDVRDGNRYKADTDFTYQAGTTYAVKMDVDVAAQTYSVSITPEGGSEVALATDYAFRAAADTLTTFAQLTIIGGMWGGSIGEISVSDLNIETTTGVENGATLPLEFALKQNYPNPFNPATKIAYEIDKPGHVELGVFSITGKQIATLVNRKQQAGRYVVEFDAPANASGVYFYRLKANGKTAVRKMMLVK